MRDADSGRMLWQSSDWQQAFTQEVHSPRTRTLRTSPTHRPRVTLRSSTHPAAVH